MQYVTAINRLKDEPLNYCWEGIHRTLPPGRSYLPKQHALAARYQNPIKGSDDPLTGDLQYYVGIEEMNDPTDPVDRSQEIELYNRKNLKNAIPVMVVQGNNGLFKVADMGPSLPLSSSFVPNDK